MTTITCDKCGEEKDIRRVQLQQSFNIPQHQHSWTTVPNASCDLCLSCMDLVSRFMVFMPKVNTPRGLAEESTG